MFALMALLMLALWCDGTARGAETLSLSEEKGPDGRVVLTIRHPAYALQVVPAEGGRGVQLTTPDGVSLLPPDDAGLFRECFSEASLQTGPPDLAFTHSVETDNGQTIRLALSTTLTPEIAGPDLAGTTLARILTCRAGTPEIEVQVQLTNNTDEVRYAGFGLLHRFGLDARGNDITYLPTTRNIQEVTKLTVNGHYCKDSPWEYAPVAGWVATRDPDTDRGLAFLMDYDSLDAFYTSPTGGALGWYVDGGELPPGACFSSSYALIPFHGFKGMTHVSDRLLANIQVTAQPETVTVQHTLAAPEALRDVTLSAAVYGVRSGKTTELDSVTFGKVDGQPATQTVHMPGAQSEPLVIRVVARGAGWEEAYETLHEGQFRAVRNPGYALQCEYRRPKPERSMAATEGAAQPTARRAIDGKPKVLLLYGVYTQWYKLESVLTDCEVTLSNARTDRVENLPTPGQLGSYSLIILSDVTADSLSEAWVARLTRFTAQGGNLLFLGGPFTYGLGHFNEKKLDVLLPVEVEVFDLKWEKQGQAFAAAMAHPIVDGIDWSDAPMVYWIHKVTPKPEAETTIKAGDYPLLVTGRHGQGRVAAFMGTPLGLAPEGQTPFWEWNGWPTLIGNTVNWLLEEVL